MPLVGPGPGNRAATLDPAAVANVKAWARAASGAGDEVGVMVKQLACSEPGCRGRDGRLRFETVVAVLRESGTDARTVHKPVTEVTADDVARAFDPAPESGDRR